MPLASCRDDHNIGSTQNKEREKILLNKIQSLAELDLYITEISREVDIPEYFETTATFRERAQSLLSMAKPSLIENVEKQIANHVFHGYGSTMRQQTLRKNLQKALGELHGVESAIIKNKVFFCIHTLALAVNLSQASINCSSCCRLCGTFV